jgi:hypothetical protein
MKRTREEVRAAFKNYMLRKKEFEEHAIEELKQMREEGFFNKAKTYA